MKLFEEMPRLEGELIVLREMQAADADALAAFAASPAVYQYLPTFLYEQKYTDAHVAIERMRAECFDTHESLMLAICPQDEPEHMVGIAEVYNLGDEGHKASIGCRISEEYWGRGIATETTRTLKEYLLGEVGLSILTAHAMVENTASARSLVKNGFVKSGPSVWEDWGREEPVLVDKYVFIGS